MNQRTVVLGVGYKRSDSFKQLRRKKGNFLVIGDESKGEEAVAMSSKKRIWYNYRPETC